MGLTGFITSLVAAGERFAGFSLQEQPPNSVNFLVMFFLMDTRVSPLLSIEFEPAVSDADEDGIPDDADKCPGTAAGAVVDAHGCSVDQLVPCVGPSSGANWKNHGECVSWVAHAAEGFVAQGLLSQTQEETIIAKAAQPGCGFKIK